MKPMSEVSVQHGQQAIDHLSKAVTEETEQGNFRMAQLLLAIVANVSEIVNDGQLDLSQPTASDRPPGGGAPAQTTIGRSLR